MEYQDIQFLELTGMLANLKPSPEPAVKSICKSVICIQELALEESQDIKLRELTGMPTNPDPSAEEEVSICNSILVACIQEFKLALAEFQDT